MLYITIENARGPSRIGIVCLLEILESCLGRKLCIFADVLGYCILVYFNYHEIFLGILNYLESLTKIPKIRNLVNAAIFRLTQMCSAWMLLTCTHWSIAR